MPFVPAGRGDVQGEKSIVDFFILLYFPLPQLLPALRARDRQQTEGSTTATHLLLGLANALAVVLSGFPRLLVLPKAKRRLWFP